MCLIGIDRETESGMCKICGRTQSDQTQDSMRCRESEMRSSAFLARYERRLGKIAVQS